MSVITTRSAFFYGHTITTLNRAIDFAEGGGEIQGNIAIGTYTLTEFAEAVADALNGAGALTYTVSVDRSTGQLTITGSGTFELLTLTGTRAGTSAYTLMGFDLAADKTGASNYQGENRSGSIYETQGVVNEYVAADDWQLKENSDVSVTATGIKQTASFGDGKRIQMNIRLITDQALQNRACDPQDIINNPTGIADARDLMNYLIGQGRAEFMPDKDTPATFEKVLLERTSKSRDGTAYFLESMGHFGYLQSGTLLFRVVV